MTQTALIAIASAAVILLAAMPTSKRGKKKEVGDFSIYRYSIELIYVHKLEETKWWQFYKRKQINRWRKRKLRELGHEV